MTAHKGRKGYFMQYYAQRKSIKDGNPQTINNRFGTRPHRFHALNPQTINNRFGTRPEMERQFHLYCASAAVNNDGFEVDSIEWGTVEQGVIERKVWINEPAPEPEPETPAEQEGE